MNKTTTVSDEIFTDKMSTLSDFELLVGIIGPLAILVFLTRLTALGNKLRGSTKESPSGKVVLITGADTGFGAIFATCLTQLGYCVVAGCLNATTAAASATFSELKRWHPDTFHVVQMDVTNDEQIKDAMISVSEWLKTHPTFRFFAIINNAGITYPMVPLELCTIDSFNNVININVYGALRVFKAFLPLMRASGNTKNCGRIVVIASLAGELTCPMMSAYCASKWALLAVTDTLRYELSRFNISVSAILPDLYRTQLVLNRSGLHASLEREMEKMDPQVLEAYGGKIGVGQMRNLINSMESYANPNLTPVVNAVIDAISSKKPKRRYYPINWKSSIITSLASWFPSLLDNMVTVGLKYANKAQ